MTMILELSPEVEARAREEANRQRRTITTFSRKS